MSGALHYPPADRKSQWYGAGNATVAPTKVLWHTTETAGGWPGYSGGAMAPTLTYEPWRHLWRQHFPLNGTARALANAKDSSGYQTNRQGVCQVEVSCYCDPARFGSGKGVDRFDEQAYDDLGRFVEFMRAEWGVPAAVGVAAKPYPASYGNNGVRLSPSAFRAYRGHCGHMHAPHNHHGDFGSLNLARVIRRATTGDNDMPTIDEIRNAVWDGSLFPSPFPEDKGALQSARNILLKTAALAWEAGAPGGRFRESIRHEVWDNSKFEADGRLVSARHLLIAAADDEAPE